MVEGLGKEANQVLMFIDLGEKKAWSHGKTLPKKM
jgi:hypothetical protein